MNGKYAERLLLHLPEKVVDVCKLEGCVGQRSKKLDLKRFCVSDFGL